MLNNLMLDMYFTVYQELGAFFDKVSEAAPFAKGIDFEELLQKLTSSGKTIGGLLLMLAGVVALIIGGIRLVGNFSSKQGPQTSWFTVIALIVVGGVLSVGGLSMLDLFGQSAYHTLEESTKQ